MLRLVQNWSTLMMGNAAVQRAFALALAVLWIAVSGLGWAAQSVSSPDGKLVVRLELKEQRPTWSIDFEGQPFIRDGLLGLEAASEKLSNQYTLVNAEHSSSDTSWNAVWGNLSRIRDHYNQLTVKLQETGPAARRFDIVLRVSDQGVGLRYEIPEQAGMSRIVIKRRLTQYRFLENHTIFQNRNYEYGNVKIDSMSRSEGAVTVDIGSGRFVSLTDADRSDFPMVMWSRSKDLPNTVVGGLNSQAEGNLPYRTSWEVIIAGSTLAKLYENRFIVENLSPPCAIEDTSWIKPGLAISQVRNVQRTTADMKKLLEFASAHKIPYVEIDHSWNGAETKWTAKEIEFFDKNKSKFWDDKPEWRSNVGGNPMVAAKGWVPFRPQAKSGGNYVDLDVPALTSYGKSLRPPVGLCVYVRGELFKEFGGEHPIDTVFAAYEKMGLAGAKPGFVPAGSQYNERTIAYMVKNAAQHKLILCIHDSFYPHGLSRTYPNLVNVEGGAGDEAEHSIPPQIKSLHDVMLVFTRFLMGPFDYTPEIGRKSKTCAHQVAMVGVFHGRHTLRGGMSQWAPGGEGGGEVEFIETWPGIFDEMTVTARASDYVTVARRRGETWWVASLSGPRACSYSYPLEFLKPGVTYRASIYTDTPGSRRTTHRVQQVTSQTVIPLAMEADGGHLMILEPAR